MVKAIWPSPRDAADLFRRIHAEPDRSLRNRISHTPALPPGGAIVLRVANSETLGQDRLNLSKEAAETLDRVYGMAIHVSPQTASANTTTPACSQILLRYSRWGPSEASYRSVFLRASAYSSQFAPRIVTDSPRNIARGDFTTCLLLRLITPLVSLPLFSKCILAITDKENPLLLFSPPSLFRNWIWTYQVYSFFTFLQPF